MRSWGRGRAAEQEAYRSALLDAGLPEPVAAMLSDAGTVSRTERFTTTGGCSAG